MVTKASLQLGTNPNTQRQKEDFYATHPKALRLFLDSLQKDRVTLKDDIWECACGQGHLSKELMNKGYCVYSSDIVDRGYDSFNEQISFLDCDCVWQGDILTNPPFKLAERFLKKGMEILTIGGKLILLLKIQFLEGQKRKELFKKYPPKYVYCHSSRQLCSRNGEFEKYNATTQFYAWYVWEKGFKGETILKWI